MIKRTITTVMLLGSLAAMAGAQGQERFSIIGYGDFSLTKGVSASSDNNINLTNNNSQDYGADFGYTFYRTAWKTPLRLSANVGVGVSCFNERVNTGASSFHYAASAIADEDGNSYIRYSETSPMSMKQKSTYISIPLYVDADMEVAKFVSVYAQAGARFMVKASSSASALEGKVTSWGVYPEYDNLLIDAPIMNAFGECALNGGMAEKSKAKGFVPELMAGVGARFRVWKSLWFDLGFNYRLSGNLYDCGKQSLNGEVTAATAPVSYTVADGLKVSAPTNYMKSIKRNALMLSLGVIYRF